MLFIPRIGNAYSIALNGTVLATGGHLAATRRSLVSRSSR